MPIQDGVRDMSLTVRLGGTDCSSSSLESRAGCRRTSHPPGLRFHAWNSRPFDCSDWGWGEGWHFDLRRRVGTGWTSYHTPTSACPWSSPTSGAGRSSARPTSSVTWDGDPRSLRVAHRGRTPVSARRSRASLGSGIVTFSPPWLFRTPTGLGPLLEGTEQSLETQLRPAGRRDRDLVAQLHVHAELEARRAGDGRLRPRREPGPARAGPARDLSRTPRHSRHRSASSNPRRPRSSWNGKNDAGSWPARRSTSITSTARPRASTSIFRA